MLCRQCQKEIDVEKWKFCPNCGSGLSDEKFFYFFRKIFISKKRLVFFLLVNLIVLLGLISFIFYYQKQLNEKKVQINRMMESEKEIKIEASVANEIMPITYFGENKKLVQLKINSPSYSRIKTEVVSEGIINHETQIINLKPESRIYYLGPDISEEGFKNLENSKKGKISLKISLLSDDGRETVLLEENKEIFFHSKNDIIWEETDGTDNLKYAVRWINKDEEEIKSLVRKAADHMKKLGGESDAMVGLQGDKEEIKRQLEAIFLAISKDYQVRYVMAPFSYDNNDAQRIKTPEEVIETKSGLCVELSLLMAAALENIGLNPVIVATQDHAWAGVELNPKSENFIFIEMTALEDDPEKAISIAQENWKKAKESRLYKILNVNELRAEGYLPLGY